MPKDILGYGTPPRPPELPAWKRLIALVFWVTVVLMVYSLAIGSVVFTILALILVVHPDSKVRAFGEPVVTTWQRVRMVLFPLSMGIVFIPLALWIRRTYRQ